ncbi:zinc metalloproteinase nas-7-like [Diabrotica virgifera virgifera]|uniref:Metalloendopeptidase n=1 Tax=Diabrotica virgifera virgifera TaxID=50390 RepID=A0ABM5JM40_DIAVI|nr:zinc metalloproteinase nas-7-like [Diabrotica virgifera virgifera]
MLIHKVCVILLLNMVFLKGIASKSTDEKKSEVNFTNPEEDEIYFEGDIILSSRSLRNGIIGDTYRWDKGIIPYQISDNYSTNRKEMILRAFATFHKYTCIKFIPRKLDHKYYVNIVDEEDTCSSHVGRVTYVHNKIILGETCFKHFGNILHELMHTIGFWHEHCRFDRDKFVDIFIENVMAGFEHNFGKRLSIDFNQPYDYASIMHYSRKMHSKNGKKTIEPKDKSFLAHMGQRKGLSKIDITKINLMYNCPEKTDAIVNLKRRLYVARKNEYKNYLPDDSEN